MTKLTRKKLLAACSIPMFAVAMVSCSADGGFTEAPIIINESAAGIYTGTFTSTAGAGPVAYPVTGIISQAHIGQFIVDESDQHFSGRLQVFGSDLSGTLTQYRGVQDRFFGVDSVDSISIDGQVAGTDRIVGDYAGDADEGSLALTYADVYETESDLDKTSGIWSHTGPGGYVVTLTIEPDGEIFGSDTNGCVFSGLISILDNNYNIYRAVVLVSDCGVLDDEYNGLAYLSDVLTMSVSNDVIAFVPVLDKT